MGAPVIYKRDGSCENASFPKLQQAIRRAAADRPRDAPGTPTPRSVPEIDQCALLARDMADTVAESAYNGLCNGVQTADIATHIEEEASALASHHPDYSLIAGRMAAKRRQRYRVGDTIVDELLVLAHESGALEADGIEFLLEYRGALNALVDRSMDFRLDFFAFRTMERQLLRQWETPQALFLRAACVAGQTLEDVAGVYRMLSAGEGMLATPTLMNAGRGASKGQLSSCYLQTLIDDSIDGIFRTFHESALISKKAGGIAVDVSKLRAEGSPIGPARDAQASGIVKVARIFNETARYVDQERKRKGAIALTEPLWHADIERFVRLRRNTGPETERARDLFLQVMVPDIFMERLRDGAQWTLFCPTVAPQLRTLHGGEFTREYLKLEAEGWGARTVSARGLWEEIMETITHQGIPYIIFRDAMNAKSNERHLGPVNTSNLCTEIAEVSEEGKPAVCNLGTLSCDAFIDPDGSVRKHDLIDAARVMVRALNNVIDSNSYPTDGAKEANRRARPVGIGVQGFANALHRAMVPYDSERARRITREFFETLHYGALDESAALAERDGPFPAYSGSPTQQGLLQCDLWGAEPRETANTLAWGALRERIRRSGVRNSQLIALPPTATTSQLNGNYECFEPAQSNMIARRTQSGEFIQVAAQLVYELRRRNLWGTQMRQAILANNGSVQGKAPYAQPSASSKGAVPYTDGGRATLFPVAASRAQASHPENPTEDGVLHVPATECHPR